MATPSDGARHGRLLGRGKAGRLDQQAVRARRQVGDAETGPPGRWRSRTASRPGPPPSPASGNASTRASGTGRSRRSTTLPLSHAVAAGRAAAVGGARAAARAGTGSPPAVENESKSRKPARQRRALACDLHRPVLKVRAFRRDLKWQRTAKFVANSAESANNVSHSNIKTKSIQRPNLRRVHTKLASGAPRSHARLHPLPAHRPGREGVARGSAARAARLRRWPPGYSPANSGWQTKPDRHRSQLWRLLTTSWPQRSCVSDDRLADRAGDVAQAALRPGCSRRRRRPRSARWGCSPSASPPTPSCRAA